MPFACGWRHTPTIAFAGINRLDIDVLIVAGFVGLTMVGPFTDGESPMDRLQQSFTTLLGFAWWAMTFPLSLLFMAIAGGALWFTYRRIEPSLRRNLRGLTILPLGWISSGLWGGWFWRHWEKGAAANPPWVEQALWAPFGLTIFLSFYFILKLRGARWFSAIFAALNLYLTLVMTFLAGMAVSGTWL